VDSYLNKSFTTHCFQWKKFWMQWRWQTLPLKGEEKSLFSDTRSLTSHIKKVMFSSSFLAFSSKRTLQVISYLVLRPDSGSWPPLRSFAITQTGQITLGRAPQDNWSTQSRDLYLATRSIHNRQTYMPPAGFESTIPASERQQTYALEWAATRICSLIDFFLLAR
jgi:hypothetical protein